MNYKTSSIKTYGDTGYIVVLLDSNKNPKAAYGTIDKEEAKTLLPDSLYQKAVFTYERWNGIWSFQTDDIWKNRLNF